MDGSMCGAPSARELLAALKQAGVTPDGSRPILVVDDDPKDLKLAEKMLKDLGYKPMCRSDAEGALEAAAKETPGAVVLDLVMPGMDGFEFLRRFRETPTGRRIPVIVWTGKDLSRAERRKLKVAAQAVVLKTQGTATLIQELKAHVPPPQEASNARGKQDA